MPSQLPRAVIAREVSASYASCIRTSTEPIDVARARRQHAAYLERIRALGVTIEVLPPLDDHPDAVFIEDVAVALGTCTVITRPGADSRRGEVASTAGALAARCELARMEAPATLDGGDVLRAGALLFVGLSERTNEAGFAFLAEVAKREGLEAIGVPVSGGLHLKSSCSPLDDRTILYDRATIQGSVFESHGLRTVAVAEPIGANVLAIGATLLVSAQAPRTAEALAALGFEVVAVDVGEFHKGDGALTCLSLRLPEPR